MSLTADLFQTCCDSFSSSDGLVRLTQTLDEQGLVDWREGVDNGQPMLHALLDRPYPLTELIVGALTRHPDLLGAQDHRGVTLWQAAWNRRMHLTNNGQDASALYSVRQILVTMMAMAPESVFGTTLATQQAFLHRVNGLQDPALAQAMEQRLSHVTLSETQTTDLWRQLGPGTWVRAQRLAGGPHGLVTLTPTVTRPLWRYALTRGLADIVEETLGKGATPEQQVWMALMQDYNNAKRKKPKIDDLSSLGQSFVAEGFDEGLGTRDDLGRPAAWHLLRWSPHLMKELAATRRGREALLQQDQAGHTLAFYLFPVLDQPELLRQDLRYLGEAGLDRGFTTAIQGRGLLAQWFADPEAWAYALQRAKVPDLARCLPSTRSSLAHHGTALFMEDLFTSEGMWAMRPGDAERMVTGWLTRPNLLSSVGPFLYHLETHRETRPYLMESELGPYVPAVQAFSALAKALTEKKGINPTLWPRALQADWPSLPVSTDRLLQMLERAQTAGGNPRPDLASEMGAALAKLRETEAQRLHAPTQSRRLRPRT
jgi:hypothetical protein